MGSLICCPSLCNLSILLYTESCTIISIDSFESNNEYGALISTNNVNKYYKGPERLNVYLKDKSNSPIVGENVIININGQSYTKSTDENGVASLSLNLNKGDYVASVSYSGRFGSNSTSANVNELSKA